MKSSPIKVRQGGVVPLRKTSLSSSGNPVDIITGGLPTALGGIVPGLGALTGVGGIVGKKLLDKVSGTVRENLAENLYPVGYETSWIDEKGEIKRGGAFDKITRALFGYEDESIKKSKTGTESEMMKERIDLLQIMMGQDQKHNTIKQSKYIPTRGAEKGDVFYSSDKTEKEIRETINDKVAWMLSTEPNEHGNWVGDSSVLANTSYSMGEDEKGKYIAYFDTWDLQPFGKGKNKGILTSVTDKVQELMGVTTPNIYGRVYLKDVPGYSEEKVKEEMKNSPFRRKQKLSPKAAAAKKRRDIEFAKTPARKRKKAQNQRIGQRSDSDIHHMSNGSTKRVSIKNNRGNFGKGTKNE